MTNSLVPYWSDDLLRLLRTIVAVDARFQEQITIRFWFAATWANAG
jgi:hypothetical protein